MKREVFMYAPGANSADGSSILVEWLVKEGAHVKFGDVVVKLEGGGFYCEESVVEEGFIFFEKTEGDQVKRNEVIAVIKDKG